MPSGYTSKLYEGEQSFEDFVLFAARGIGYLVDMRDFGPDELPDETPLPSSDYVEAAEGALQEFRSASRAELSARFHRQQAAKAEQVARENAKEAALTDRYTNMLDKVEQWTPPTEEHFGLKEFMIEQLESSIRFDTGYADELPTETYGEWYREKLERLTKNVESARRGHDESVARVEKRNAWVRALKESLVESEVSS